MPKTTFRALALLAVALAAPRALAEEPIKIGAILAVTGPARYDLVVGKHFCRFMADVVPGPNCPTGGDSPTNRFFPTPGNHDHDFGPISNYLAYFNLPGGGVSSSGTSGKEAVVRRLRDALATSPAAEPGPARETGVGGWGGTSIRLRNRP